MRNFLEKPKPVLVRTGQTWLLKTGLKQFGCIILDVPDSNARHGVLFVDGYSGELQRLGNQTLTKATQNVSLAVQQTVFQLFLQQSLAGNFKRALDDHGGSVTTNNRNGCWVQPGHISAQECFKSACYGKYWRFCVKRAVKSVSKGVRRGFACVGDTG